MQLLGNIFRKLPSFRGKQRLASLLLGKKRLLVKNVEIVAANGIRYVLPNLVETVGFELFVNGIYEETTLKLIQKQLRTGSIWLDIGANIGSVCIPVAKAMPDISVLAVEASPKMVSYLEKNISLNQLTNVKLVHKAMSDIDAQSVAFYSPEEKYGKGSFSNAYNGNMDLVETVQLDTLLKEQGITSVSFIKIDVEGYEYAVFKGATQLLMRPDAPDILFEFMDWAEAAVAGQSVGDAQRLLITYGYTLYGFDIHGGMFPLSTIVTVDYQLLYASKKQQACSR